MSLSTNPNPLIPNQPGTLSYTNSSIVQVGANSYVLKDINNNSVSSTIINGSTISSISSTQAMSLMTTDASGNMYYSNNYTGNNETWVTFQNTIYKTSPSGVPTAIVFSGTQPILYCVTGLAFDSSGALYLTSRVRSSVGNVYRCVYSSSTGQYTATLIITTELSYPVGIVISSSNYIYISDITYNSVIRYPPSTGGTVSGTTIITGLSTPCGLTLDSTQSNIYIANYGNGQILKYPIGGGTKVIYYTFGSSTQPYGIVMDSNNNLYMNSFYYGSTYKLLPATTYSASSIASTVTQIYQAGNDRSTGISLYNTSGNLYILINNSGGNSYKIYSYYYPSTFNFSNVILSITQYNLSIWNTTYNTKIVSNLIVYTGTQYLTNGQDIFNIFSVIQYGYTGPYASKTSYNIEGTDLNQVFKPYISGTSTYITGYNTNNIPFTNIFDLQNPFTVTGNCSINLDSNYYTITFIGNGTISFNDNYSINLVVVGGAGGGGGGSYGAGGGGGGGGIGILNFVKNLPDTIYTVTVGTGGGGGTGNLQGGDGTNSSFIDNLGNNILTSNGGGGGGGYYYGSGGGIGGTSSSIYNFTQYTASNGGRGYYTTGEYPPSNGISTTPAMPITLEPNQLFYFGGGGGGGNYNSSGYTFYVGGSCGVNGSGGAAAISSTTTGISATSYGSGGGGAGVYSKSTSSNYIGGSGAQGVVIINFEYSF